MQRNEFLELINLALYVLIFAIKAIAFTLKLIKNIVVLCYIKIVSYGSRNRITKDDVVKNTRKISVFRAFLFIIGATYLVVETYYITAFINSYSLTSNNDILAKYKDVSRLLSSAGIALSMFITSFFFIRRKFHFNSFGIACVIAIASGSSIYYGVERVINEQVKKAPEEVVLCGFLGGFAKKTFLLGKGDAVPFWNAEKAFTPFEDIQVGLNLLPAALCTNKELLIASIATRETHQALANMIKNKINEIYQSRLEGELDGVERKLNYLRSNLDRIYEGHRKVVEASADWRYRRYLKGFDKALKRNGMSYTTRELIIDITNKTRENINVKPSKGDLYESIIRSEMRGKVNDLIKGQITLDRDLIKDIKAESKAQVNRLIAEVVSQWSRGVSTDKVSVPYEMREMVKVVVAPLVLMSISGLSIMLTAAAIVSLLIPEASKRVTGNALFYKGKYYSLALMKTALSPISVILVVILLMPISPTQAFFMKDMEEGKAKFLVTNLLKAQFYIYPKSILLFSKVNVRPTLEFSKEMLNNESDMIHHFEKTMRASSRSYKFTTPSIQSVIFSGIAISNYKTLTEEQHQYIEKAKGFYQKTCGDGDEANNSLSCIKRNYLNRLNLNQSQKLFF